MSQNAPHNSTDTLLRINIVPEAEGKSHAADMLLYILMKYRINILFEQYIFHFLSLYNCRTDVWAIVL